MAWTKAKTAIVAGVVVLFAAGTTTVVTTKIIQKDSADALYEKMWAHPNSDSMDDLEKAPPVLKIRPTHYPNRAGGINTSTGRSMYVNASVLGLMSFAYGFVDTRMIVPDGLPSGGFDYLNSLPTNTRISALQAEIKQRFGLTAHPEMRATDVLLLKVSDPTKLQLHLTNGGRFANYGTGEGNIQKRIYRNVNLSAMCSEPEAYLKKPVIDETGMTAHYNFDIQWTEQNWSSSVERLATVGKAWINQLSVFAVELVPTSIPIEMLVVEKAK